MLFDTGASRRRPPSQHASQDPRQRATGIRKRLGDERRRPQVHNLAQQIKALGISLAHHDDRYVASFAKARHAGQQIEAKLLLRAFRPAIHGNFQVQKYTGIPLAAQSAVRHPVGRAPNHIDGRSRRGHRGRLAPARNRPRRAESWAAWRDRERADSCEWLASDSTWPLTEAIPGFQGPPPSWWRVYYTCVY